MKRNKRFIKFIENARAIHGYKYEYLDYINMRSNIKLSFNGEIFYQNPLKHLMGRCPEKNIPKLTNDEFIFRSKKIWGDRFDYSKTVYDGALCDVIIIDKISGVEYKQRANSHLNGVDPFKKMTTEDFIRLSTDKYGDDYDYSMLEYKDYHKKVKIIFKKTGEIFEQTPANHLYSGHRPERIKRKDTESFIIDSNLIHDNRYDYSKTDYKTSVIKVTITCKIHGDFSQTPNSHLCGYGCPNCNESRGEKEIAKFLNKNDITYSRQHKFYGCRNIFELPFDFYIPSMRACVEFDGKQHYEPMELFGGVSTHEQLKINDKIKSDYCEDNYINLIRIRYDQYDDIYQILWENLGYHIRRLKLNKN